jgi:nicotinamide-nucleotide amidase
VNHHAHSDNELALLAVRTSAALRGQQLRVATAESCTGGYVAKLLTDIPGSSSWFDCGFVTYSNEAKQRELGVSAETLAQHGAVSEATVVEMAVGALAASGVQVALAISGVAGPDGGTPAHPVGDVWFCRAVVRPDQSVGAVSVHRRFAGDRDAIRRQAAAYALEMLQEV